jgi:hypothetical protein
MTLVKYAVAMAVWALFYLVVAFAIAIGFGAGWKLINGGYSRPQFLKFRRKEGGNNGNNGHTAARSADAVPAG